MLFASGAQMTISSVWVCGTKRGHTWDSMASSFLSSCSNSSISSCSVFFDALGIVVLAGFLMAPFDEEAFVEDGGETLVFGVAPFEPTGRGIFEGLGGEEFLRSRASAWAWKSSSDSAFSYSLV